MLKTSWLLPGPEAPSNPGGRPPRSPGTGFFFQARPEDFIEPARRGWLFFFAQQFLRSLGFSFALGFFFRVEVLPAFSTAPR